MQFDSTAGLLIFLVVLSFPFIALLLPFANNWYQNNAEMIDGRVQSTLQIVKKFREARHSTYSGNGTDSE
jgi:hypothetical protein